MCKAYYIKKLADEDKFSGAVLLANDDKPIFQKAYCLASKEFNVPNQIDTKFNVASMGKMFTGIAVAQLAEQGRLSFNDFISKHLPDYIGLTHLNFWTGRYVQSYVKYRF